MSGGAGLRRSSRIMGLAVAALLVADVVGLADHGSESGSAAGAQSIRATLARASAHTLGRGTARLGVSLHIRVQAAGVDQTVDEAMQGEGDLSHRLIDMSVVSGAAVVASITHS